MEWLKPESKPPEGDWMITVRFRFPRQECLG